MSLERQRCSRQGFRSTTALPSDYPRPTADLFVLTHRPICSNGEIFARLCRHRLVCRLHERPRLRDSLIGSTSGDCLFWPVFHGGRQRQRRMLSKREPRACAGDVANRPTARNRGSGALAAVEWNDDYCRMTGRRPTVTCSVSRLPSRMSSISAFEPISVRATSRLRSSGAEIGRSFQRMMMSCT